MIDGKRILAVIPARGGSKGVPGKNLRAVGGKPLIAWTLEAARAARLPDRVIVSSDDRAIIEAARQWGGDVPFVREARLADDHTPTIEVALDALERCPGHDWLVLLQPTSPLRIASDIDAAIELCARSGAPACVSVCRAQESPYWMYTLADGGRLAPLLPQAAILRRQDLPAVYSLNGAVYVARADWLRQERRFVGPATVAYEMPPEHSVDIDTERDFSQLQFLLDEPRDVSLSPTT